MRTMSGTILSLLLATLLVSGCQAATKDNSLQSLEAQCQRAGWQMITLRAAGLQRSVLWQAPRVWQHGAIVVLHGGGGSHQHFCGGGKLVQPQIAFARSAIAQGFAVFLLDATMDIVTDAVGRTCGKRFDFSVLHRPNVDLPYIRKVLDRVIPQRRPAGSAPYIFMTGLSTGGYMTIRAATHFDDRITAFAPVSAGDPYGTETNCDTRLSQRTSAKGILQDLETGKEITELGACRARRYSHEYHWESHHPAVKPRFKQFHNQGDGIVDISCMRKVQRQLEQHGYRNDGEFVLGSRRRSALNHLWLRRYNQPILDFFIRVSRSN